MNRRHEYPHFPQAFSLCFSNFGMQVAWWSDHQFEIANTSTPINGCDPTHTVEILENDLYERQDSIALCSGDSVLVLGKRVFHSGMVQEIMASQSGCDKLWTIEVQEIEAPVINLFVTEPDQQNALGKIEVSGSVGALYSLNGVNFSVQTIFG